MIDRFAIIIGAMKCGTTSLFNYLAQHPQIAPCREKEPSFFARDAELAKGLDHYDSLWDFDPAAHRVAMEGSTDYAKMPRFPNVAQRIAQVPDRDFRFIYVMRHPVDRIESQTVHGTFEGRKRPIFAPIKEHEIEISQYAMQLDAYVEAFGRGRLLLLFTEDLKARPLETVREVCRFIDVDPDYPFEGLDVVHHQRKGYLDQMVHPWILAARRAPRLHRAARTVLPYRLRQSITRHLGGGSDRHFRLSRRKRRYIHRRLLADLRRLHEVYGVDVEGRWGLSLNKA